MKRVVIFGGTGFIGMNAAKYLSEKGFTPILVARNKPKSCDFDFYVWDAIHLGEWAKMLEGAEAIINLAGKSVDCIKTPDNCDLILKSRVDSTAAIGAALLSITHKPKVWVQISTAHIYGDSPKKMSTESSSLGYGLAPFIGKKWEETFAQNLPKDMRGVVLRTSFVLGKNGGALTKLKQITKLGLGGKIGHGNQGISWIHEEDMNELIFKAITNENYHGTYVASSPNPVSQKEFMKTLRKVLRIPFGLPSPFFLTRFGAKFLFKSDPELAIYGRYVTSERLENQGFTFQFPNLKEALNNLK